MKNIRNSLLLLLTAVIWGIAFVAQSAGMEYVGGFTFNCVRSLIGGAVLIPCIFLMRAMRAREAKQEIQSDAVTKKPVAQNHDTQSPVAQNPKTVLVGGVCCGLLLCVASNLQQQGIKYTTVGKAGFITALYIVLVPILGLFFHRKVGKLVWVGVLFAVAGLYFLCISEQFTVGVGDLLVLLCAIVFSAHILVIDYFAPMVDCVAMSCIQFFTCGILSGIPMLLFEQVSWENLKGAAVPILYAGVMSCGVAYTLQIIGQKNMNPTVASMILSLESVVSVLAGLVILGQMLSGREMLGCVLMFVAVVLAQLPEDFLSRKGKI